MDRRVTPPKRVTSPTWSPSPPCKQVLSYTFYGGNAIRVLVHFVFHCRPFSPCIGGRQHFSFCHHRYKIFMLFFQQKKCLLCLFFISRSRSLSPFFLVKLRWPAAYFLFSLTFSCSTFQICGHDN